MLQLLRGIANRVVWLSDQMEEAMRQRISQGVFMIGRLLYRIILFLIEIPRKWLIIGGLVLLVSPFLGVLTTLFFEHWDDDPDRGAVAMEQNVLGEHFSKPEYLDQGWDASDSLWFYNTTQGSALIPYDFMLALERSDSDRGNCQPKSDKIQGESPWFLCDTNMDYFRYLPQKKTSFNPNALAVGFTKEEYKGKDYFGFTCAACHTAQVNFQGRALRIDGGPAMADMVGFLKDLEKSLASTAPDRSRSSNPRFERFADNVIALGNDYDTRAEVETDLRKWIAIRQRYNIINDPMALTAHGKTWENRSVCGPDNSGKKKHEYVEYGYARLDAFGRIYNRVLQHTINAQQFTDILRSITTCKGVAAGNPPALLLTQAQVEKVMEDFNQSGATILRDEYFTQILANLRSDAPGYPNLSATDMLRVRNAMFNPPSAPVSYPFLWDITRADFVQWNGLANNATLGPLGRNAGEVTGVFGILDWHEEKGWWSKLKNALPSFLSGQKTKAKAIAFDSSIDLFNLQRLERKLTELTAPAWPFCRKSGEPEDEIGSYYLPGGEESPYVDRRDCKQGDRRIDPIRVDRGRILYEKHCQSCHDVIDPRDPDRVMISFMLGIQDSESTDKAMAENSVAYNGMAGNFKDTYQDVGVGNMIVPQEAPVALLLTAATKGTVSTTDFSISGIAKWIYTVVMSISDNPVKQSMKAGSYTADTTASPFASLQSYRARSLDGIWATAPYLHNGSVPTLWDLLLPEKATSACKSREERPSTFIVGPREFDPIKVGFVSQGVEGFSFKTGDRQGTIRGNGNGGHEYGACEMTNDDRLDLIEYMKSL